MLILCYIQKKDTKTSDRLYYTQITSNNHCNKKSTTNNKNIWREDKRTTLNTRLKPFFLQCKTKTWKYHGWQSNKIMTYSCWWCTYTRKHSYNIWQIFMQHLIVYLLIFVFPNAFLCDIDLSFSFVITKSWISKLVLLFPNRGLARVHKLSPLLPSASGNTALDGSVVDTPAC